RAKTNANPTFTTGTVGGGEPREARTDAATEGQIVQELPTLVRAGAIVVPGPARAGQSVLQRVEGGASERSSGRRRVGKNADATDLSSRSFAHTFPARG